MNLPLFRKEVLNRNADKLVGDVIIQPHLSIRVWLLCIFIVGTVFFAFIIFATYTKKEMLVGEILPATGLVDVYSERSGKVAKVLVENGRHVCKGCPLMEVDTEKSTDVPGDTGGSIIGSIELQISNLNEQIKILEIERTTRIALLKGKIENSKQQLNSLNLKKAIHDEKLRLAQARLRSIDKLLKKSLISEDEYSRFKDGLLSEQLVGQELALMILQAKNNIEEDLYNVSSVESEFSREANKLNNDVLDVRQRLVSRKMEERYVITAPIEGTISTMQVYEGMRLDTQKLALAILPSNSILEAEIYIPTRAIGLLHTGQSVDIKYDAFPYEKYGFFRGTIDSLSKTTVTAGQSNRNFTAGGPVYLGRIKIERSLVSTDGKEHLLQVGMTLQAYAHIETRPLYQWIIKPIVTLLDTN